MIEHGVLPEPGSSESHSEMSDCRLSSGASGCRVYVDRHIGHALIKHTYRPCAQPNTLDLHVDLPTYGHWEFNFRGDNPSESRQIGPDVWPIELRVDFGDGRDSPALRACFETKRTGERSCFLEESHTPQCQRSIMPSADGLSSLLVLGALCLSFLLLCLSVAAVLFTLHSRRRKHKLSLQRLQRRRSYRRYRQSFTPSEFTGHDHELCVEAPALPGAKSHPANETTASLKQQRRHSVASERAQLLAVPQVHISADERRRSLPHPRERDSLYVIEELSVELNISDSEDSGKILTTAKQHAVCQSKEVQTSATSLDTGIASSPSGHGSHDGDKGGHVRDSPV